MISQHIATASSPKSVMATWWPAEDDHHDIELPKVPTMMKHTIVEHHGQQKVMPVVKEEQFHESKPYYGKYIIQPTNQVQDAFFHALLPINATAAIHASQAFITDILVNQLHFIKNEYNDNMFVGYVQGRRVVIGCMNSNEEESNNTYGIACEEEDPVQMLLLVLRTLEVEATKL